MTTPVLGHFARDQWITPSAGSTPLLDAVTGEEVASISDDELDVAAMVDHARSVGHESLRPLTFHQRALILKQLALHLQTVKDQLYPLSYRTGATHSDSWVDIDGGIGVLLSYGSRGRRDMPNDTVYLDGPAEPLSKNGTFLAQHIYTSLPGVAVQINAFNFPVWGMLEKFAPAFLAGVPSIVKPASPSAFLTEATVRAIIDSGILPPGTLQLITGSARGVMDHLDERDLVAFTGSASTAQKLRTDPAVIVRGTRFTAEADSLNSSVLAPDASPDTPEFDLFVRGLVTEMTAKAGQKCTAIRRAFVPNTLQQDVIDAVDARIAAKVRVGAPTAEGVTMGALVSTAQRDEVLDRVAELRSGGAELVLGDPDDFAVQGADAGRGAFLPPLLLRADASVAAAHAVEAFGPVSTVIGYDSLEQAAEFAARGRGSLVASVITHSPDTARTLVRAMAPMHGRILLLDRDDAKASTGHGSPLPTLVHGGPGRAGGGEEMGGVRGVLHHMQRTAVQGSPDLLTAVGRRYVTGAQLDDQRTDGWQHPFRKSLAELKIGDAVTAGPRTVTLDDIEAFARSTGDEFYAHMDEDAAAANPFFGGRVAHGYLLLSWAAGLFVDPAPGPVLANTGLEDLRFRTPVQPGDEITVQLVAGQITPRETDDYGEVRWHTTITNQRDEIVATYTVLTMVSKTPQPSAEPRVER